MSDIISTKIMTRRDTINFNVLEREDSQINIKSRIIMVFTRYSM